MTGQIACQDALLTEPSTALLKAPRPRCPSTTRSAPSAASSSTGAGPPATASTSTDTSGVRSAGGASRKLNTCNYPFSQGDCHPEVTMCALAAIADAALTPRLAAERSGR